MKTKKIIYEGEICTTEEPFDHYDRELDEYHSVYHEIIDVVDNRHENNKLTDQLWEMWNEKGTKVRVTVEVLQ